MGESIFLINKNEIVGELEKKYPFMRVVSIETKFPNKLVIHSAERESLFAVELSNNEFAIIDGMGKVLKYTNSSIFAGHDLGTKPIKLYFGNSISINPEHFVIGENVKEIKIVSLVNQISKALLESGYSPTTSKGVFTSISVDTTVEGSTVNMQTRNDMIIKLNNAEQFMTDKLLLGLQLYNTWQQQGAVSGIVDVWHNKIDGVIRADYIEK